MSATPLTLLAYDLPCCKCQYNLRTISQSAVCPECGTAVATSLDFQKTWNSLDFRLFHRGVLLIALCLLGVLFAETYVMLFMPSSSVPARVVWIGLTVILAVFEILGVTFLAFSRPSIPLPARILVVAISVITDLMSLIAQAMGLFYVLAYGTPAPSLPALAGVYAILFVAHFLDLGVIILGWIFMHDFAVRAQSHGLLKATHFNFAACLLQGLYHLVFYGGLLLYLMNLPGIHFSPSILFTARSFIPVVFSAIYTVYWFYVLRVAADLRHFVPRAVQPIVHENPLP